MRMPYPPTAAQPVALPLRSLRRYLRLWRYLAVRSVMAQMTYRGDFLMGLARNVGYIAMAVIFYKVLFLRTSSIAGWNQAAILTLFGTLRLVKGLLYFFVEENIETIPALVRNGEMDFVLLKPVSARFLLSCSRVSLGAASNGLIGAALVVVALRSGAATASPSPAPDAVAWSAYVAMVACAVVVFYNILFMVLTISFWAVKIEGLPYLFEDMLNLAGLPISVYRGALGAVFSYVIPLAIAATVPAGLLVGRQEPVFFVYAPVCAVLTAVASQWLWRRALAGYTSAGG